MGVNAKNISPLAIRFQFDDKVIKKEFSNLLQSMMTHNKEKYCALKDQGDVLSFWSYFLRSPMVTWHNDLRKLLHIALSIPISSADVERGFSVMNHFKINRRKSLTAKHIEDIIRIRINGPSIKNFSAQMYTLHWLNANHVDSANTKSSRKSDANDNNDDKSSLF